MNNLETFEITNKFYFDIDLVTSIQLTVETQSVYKWFEEIPAKPKTFLGFKIGMTKPVKAGWSDYKDGRYRVEASYFRGYSSYRIDEVSKRIFNRASVTINHGHKTSFHRHFDSTEKAQAYVDELINLTGKTFEIIIKH
jgi:hypothetical protein